MAEVTAKKVILKNKNEEYLLPYTIMDEGKLEAQKCYITGNVLSDTKGYEQLLEMKENNTGTGADRISSDYDIIGDTVTVDSNDIASGFSDTGYITSIDSFSGNTSQTYEVHVTITIPEAVDNPMGIINFDNYAGNLGLNTNNQLVVTWLIDMFDVDTPSNIKSDKLVSGQTYDVVYGYNGSAVFLQVLLDGEEVSYTSNTNPSFYTRKTCAVLVGSSNFDSQTLTESSSYIYKQYYWGGSIDLNSISVYRNNELVWEPFKKLPYVWSKTGSKIADMEYLDLVQSMYEQKGYAPYYTINETDKTFTLPMGEVYGMIEQIDEKLGDIETILDDIIG